MSRFYCERVPSVTVSQGSRMLTFDTCSFRDLSFTSGFGALVCEYAEETANPAIGEAVPQMEKYYDLDREGKIRVIRVCDDGQLVGAAVLLLTVSQHYPFPMVGVPLPSPELAQGQYGSEASSDDQSGSEVARSSGPAADGTARIAARQALSAEEAYSYPQLLLVSLR